MPEPSAPDGAEASLVTPPEAPEPQPPVSPLYAEYIRVGQVSSAHLDRPSPTDLAGPPEVDLQLKIQSAEDNARNTCKAYFQKPDGFTQRNEFNALMVQLAEKRNSPSVIDLARAIATIKACTGSRRSWAKTAMVMEAYPAALDDPRVVLDVASSILRMTNEGGKGAEALIPLPESDNNPEAVVRILLGSTSETLDNQRRDKLQLLLDETRGIKLCRNLRIDQRNARLSYASAVERTMIPEITASEIQRRLEGISQFDITSENTGLAIALIVADPKSVMDDETKRSSTRMLLGFTEHILRNPGPKPQTSGETAAKIIDTLAGPKQSAFEWGKQTGTIAVEVKRLVDNQPTNGTFRQTLDKLHKDKLNASRTASPS